MPVPITHNMRECPMPLSDEDVAAFNQLEVGEPVFYVFRDRVMKAEVVQVNREINAWQIDMVGSVPRCPADMPIVDVFTDESGVILGMKVRRETSEPVQDSDSEVSSSNRSGTPVP